VASAGSAASHLLLLQVGGSHVLSRLYKHVLYTSYMAFTSLTVSHSCPPFRSLLFSAAVNTALRSLSHSQLLGFILDIFLVVFIAVYIVFLVCIYLSLPESLLFTGDL
jgi:hypothetical protein